MNQKGFIQWIILVTLLIAGVIFIYFKSSDSLPGEIIYPVKEIKENLSLVGSSSSYQSGAVVYLDLTKERFEETLGLIEEKKSDDQIKTALDKLTSTQKETLQYLHKGKANGNKLDKQLEELDKMLTEQREVLSTLLYRVPYSLYDPLKSTIETVSENIQKTREIKAKPLEIN